MQPFEGHTVKFAAAPADFSTVTLPKPALSSAAALEGVRATLLSFSAVSRGTPANKNRGITVAILLRSEP